MNCNINRKDLKLRREQLKEQLLLDLVKNYRHDVPYSIGCEKERDLNIMNAHVIRKKLSYFTTEELHPAVLSMVRVFACERITTEEVVEQAKAAVLKAVSEGKQESAILICSWCSNTYHSYERNGDQICYRCGEVFSVSKSEDSYLIEAVSREACSVCGCYRVLEDRHTGRCAHCVEAGKSLQSEGNQNSETAQTVEPWINKYVEWCQHCGEETHYTFKDTKVKNVIRTIQCKKCRRRLRPCDICVYIFGRCGGGSLSTTFQESARRAFHIERQIYETLKADPDLEILMYT